MSFFITPKTTTAGLATFRLLILFNLVLQTMAGLVTFKLLGLFNLVQNHTTDTFTLSLRNKEDEVAILFRRGLNLDMISAGCTATSSPKAWSNPNS
jgi:hypothetical protein